MTGKQSSRSGTYFGKKFFYHSDGQPDSPGGDEAMAAEGMFYHSYIPNFPKAELCVRDQQSRGSTPS